MDYYEKGCLSYYINRSKGFEEKIAKIIFKKILKSINFCHKNHICHLDIKPDNILLTSDFDPIFIDFGLSDYFDDSDEVPLKYNIRRGSYHYMSPEIFSNKIILYSGIKADIFSLGVLLFHLVTGKYGFKIPTNKDNSYKYIIDEKNELFWTTVKGNIENKELSEEFKNLYIQMISFKPEKRPSIDEILTESPWMKEINELKEEDKDKYDELKEQMSAKFFELEDEMTKDNKEVLEVKPVNNVNENKPITKSYDNNDKQYFGENLEPKKFDKNEFVNHFVKIKGYIEPKKFIKSLIESIKMNFDVYFEFSEENLGFTTFFDFGENYEIEGFKEEEDIILGISCVIQISLVQLNDKEYLVQFLKIEGQTEDYYGIFLKIKNLIKNILCF